MIYGRNVYLVLLLVWINTFLTHKRISITHINGVNDCNRFAEEKRAVEQKKTTLYLKKCSRYRSQLKQLETLLPKLEAEVEQQKEQEVTVQKNTKIVNNKISLLESDIITLRQV